MGGASRQANPSSMFGAVGKQTQAPRPQSQPKQAPMGPMGGGTIGGRYPQQQPGQTIGGGFRGKPQMPTMGQPRQMGQTIGGGFQAPPMGQTVGGQRPQGQFTPQPFQGGQMPGMLRWAQMFNQPTIGQGYNPYMPGYSQNSNL